MKKAIIIIPLLLIFTLTGCKALTEYTEPEKVSIVSAIGFDSENGSLKVSIETVVNSDSKQNGKILSLTADTAENAIKKADSTVVNTLLLSHCGVIILSVGLESEQIKDILLYCKDSAVPLNTCVIFTDSAESLLDSKEDTLAGYDILSFLDNKNSDFHYPLYSVLGELVSDASITLPEITSQKDGYSAEEIITKEVNYEQH